MTGTYRADVRVNDLGTAEIHKRHKTSLEQSDGAFLRVRVKDQLFIDELLLKRKIDCFHHAIAEKILSEAVRASVYIKSPSMEAGGLGSIASKYSNYLLIFSRTLKRIITKFGCDGERLVFDVVVNNTPISNDDEIKKLKEILTYLGRGEGYGTSND
jgi:predicted polyphosphate/ATP-dependent NAD kinase|tara:strand:+ start:970 stop:1440 length:471 start_codon:yes stop_codon:yes gene_type:complete